MVSPMRWMSTAIVHGVRRASIKQPSNSSTDQGGGKRRISSIHLFAFVKLNKF
jgi:hypothetical protein